MTITFRVDDGHNILSSSPAVITPDQLGALRDLLDEHSGRTEVSMVIPIHGEPASGSFEIEVRVCPLALASIPRCFDYDPAVIAVIDEAQFRARRIRVWQQEPTGDLRLGLGLNPDGVPELEVANGNAFALLASLCLDEDSCGAIPLSQLRQRLMDPRIRRRLDEDPQMSRYVEALTTMAALKAIPPRMGLTAQRATLSDPQGRPAYRLVRTFFCLPISSRLRRVLTRKQNGRMR